MLRLQAEAEIGRLTATGLTRKQAIEAISDVVTPPAGGEYTFVELLLCGLWASCS